MANLTTTDVKTLFSVYKGNLGGSGDTEFLQWMNFINQELYEAFISINPEDYLSYRIIKTIIGTSAYTLPSNYQNSYIGGLYLVESGTDYYSINYDTETVSFSTIPQTITGGTSGATGTLKYISDYGTTGTLTLTNVSGTFQDNEILTGSSEGSATSNGTAYGFEFTDRKLPVTGFGSKLNGYWIDASNINITPTPDTTNVYVFKYIPILSDLTSISQESIIPTRYKQAIRNVIEVFWDQWRQNSSEEIMSSQRSQQAIQKMLVSLKKTPAIMLMPNRSNSYTRLRRVYDNTKY